LDDIAQNLALADSAREGLFAVDVFARLDVVDAADGVPVVGQRRADCVDVELGEHLAVVVIARNVRAEELAGGAQPVRRVVRIAVILAAFGVVYVA